MLQVPNKYFSDWLTAHQKDFIEKMICGGNPRDIRLDFEEVQDLTCILKKVEDMQEPLLKLTAGESPS